MGIAGPWRISIDQNTVRLSMTTPAMIQTTVQPPAQPAPPGVPQAAAPAIAGVPIPQTFAEVQALRSRRTELSNQITSASRRRDEAVRDLQRSPSSGEAGLQGRIAVLDQRIMQLESDIAETGRALAMAPPFLNDQTSSVGPPERYGPFSPGQLTGITIVSIGLIWAPIAFALARTIIRRWAHAKPAPQVLEANARLERMEQAIEAVAIEVERISEGQRFVTQAISKREGAPALGVGQAPAEPIRVADAQTVAR